MSQSVLRRFWGMTPKQVQVDLFWLTSRDGVHARVSTLGATLVGLDVPAGPGRVVDVVLGYDTLEEYLHDPVYMGALVGRYAGRIQGACFNLDGRDVLLDRNHGRHHLHGGGDGFHRRVWHAETGETDGPWVRMTLKSPDGDQGYPGTLLSSVTYHLQGRTLRITMTADTDRPTVCNLTSHAYFNLAGGGTPSIWEHELSLDATMYLELDEENIPTGRVLDVADSRFDLRAAKKIGNCRDAAGRGLDQYFCIPGNAGALRYAARLHDPRSGRSLVVRTTQPGMQVYTADAWPEMRGKGGCHYAAGAAVALETQMPADAPRHQGMAEAVLQPGQTYTQITEFELDWDTPLTRSTHG